MSRLNFFFSFRGRINRARYWAYVGFVLLGAVLLLLVSFAVTEIDNDVISLTTGAFIVCGLLAYWASSLAISTKRLHDRDKSAWWLVPFFLLPGSLSGIAQVLTDTEATGPMILLTVISFPLIIWGVIEIAFLKGTDGPNRYGADPLGGTESIAKTFD